MRRPRLPASTAKRARLGGQAARPRTAASDGTAIFQPIFDQSRIIVIDLKAGRRRWSFQAKGWIYGEPTVTDDRVFFGSQDNHLYCLDKRRKTLFWTLPHHVPDRGRGRVSRRLGLLRLVRRPLLPGECRDGQGGLELRDAPIPGVITAIYSAPLCTEDAVYFGSFDGYLYGLKLDTGELKWRIRPVEGSHITGSPLTDGRRLFVSIQRRSGNPGEHAIVAIGEDEGKQGDVEKERQRQPAPGR